MLDQVTALPYVGIPSCLIICKDFRFLEYGSKNVSNSLSLFSFTKSILFIGILLGVALFFCMNYLLPDCNYQARTYMQLAKMSENFDNSVLERIQKSNYRSEREKDISVIKAELGDIEKQLKKIEQNENMKSRELIQKHWIEKERQVKIRLYNFLKFPIYLVSIIILMIPGGLLIRRLNKGLIVLVSLVLLVLFHVIFLESEFIVENVNYPLIILFTPELFVSMTGVILLFYLNKKYVVQNQKG